MMNRRALLTAGAAALAFGGLSRHAQAATVETYLNQVAGFGPLKPDPAGLMDLPEGFSYRVISRLGEVMSDGFLVPGQFDGMGCFPLDEQRVILVRNHELKPNSASHAARTAWSDDADRLSQLDASKVYGHSATGDVVPGGTTTLVYNIATGQTERQHLSLIGTSTNCAGGVTPWGSWLTCEETEARPGNAAVTQSHGYVFEVPASATGLVDPVPLKDMGRFYHEAVCVDPGTGIVYLTEDKVDGLFYRFIPNTPGELARGGRLQALAVRGAPGADTTNHEERFWAVEDWLDAEWIDLEDVDSPNDDLRLRGRASGAAIFARGEGIHWGDGELYLTATSGGPVQRGQILRYRPSPHEGRPEEAASPGRIQLFVQSADDKVMNMADNLTVSPWGHLIVCEDNYSRDIRNHLKGVTPDGRVYTLARNPSASNSEFAGACFSDDGSTLFVNYQHPGLTFAITGPWDQAVSS
jgi:secreted PhoX family phosphatase